MKKNKISIYVERHSNPLYNAIRDVIVKSKNLELVENVKTCKVIIILSYSIEKNKINYKIVDDIIEDISLKKMKIIFLSWFHLFKDFEEYVDYLSIQTCDLMNTEKYSVLQLPVQAEVLLKEITSFYEQK